MKPDSQSDLLYPFTFEPIFKERIWGGRSIERLYRKPLPPKIQIGESWEIVDRPEAISIINSGPLAGKSLRWLMEHHATEVLGKASSSGGRFPLLIKILDAEEKLSLQVHPPEEFAAGMGGEAKTEMWYVAEARPGAEFFVGLKRGTTRSQFEAAIRNGSVADCFHRLQVRSGDAMFLPSGRVHAIGGSVVIFEVQQNSDTTYRVFDWNRLDASGKPRELHLEQSLRSIDFNDFEPELVRVNSLVDRQYLVQSQIFNVELRALVAPERIDLAEAFAILAIVSGEITIQDDSYSTRLNPGQFCLIPASLGDVELAGLPGSKYLSITPGSNPSTFD